MGNKDKRDFKISLVAGLFAVSLVIVFETVLELINIVFPFDERIGKGLLVLLIGIFLYWYLTPKKKKK